jgi:hypothetical protein
VRLMQVEDQIDADRNRDILNGPIDQELGRIADFVRLKK